MQIKTREVRQSPKADSEKNWAASDGVWTRDHMYMYEQLWQNNQTTTTDNKNEHIHVYVHSLKE